jgi:pimeloyl-ACP methyl ester carboxylesterase
MDPSLPLLVARGETTDTFVARAAARFHELAPWAGMVTIPGHGHLFPLSAPDATAQTITAWLARMSPGAVGVR